MVQPCVSSRFVARDYEKGYIVEPVYMRTNVKVHKKVAVWVGILSFFYGIATAFGRRKAAADWNHDSGIFVIIVTITTR